MRFQLQSRVKWSVWQDKQSSYWIAVCDPLGLTVDGESIDDLIKTLLEAQRLLFTDLLEEGDMDRFLTKRGWVMARPSVSIPNEPPTFDIPFELAYDGAPSGIARAQA